MQLQGDKAAAPGRDLLGLILNPSLNLACTLATLFSRITYVSYAPSLPLPMLSIYSARDTLYSLLLG